MKYYLALILLCSMTAFAQEAKAPASVTPPAEWLQKYVLYVTKNAEVTQLRKELAAEMDSKGYTLDASTVQWIPKAKPEIKPEPAPDAKE